MSSLQLTPLFNDRKLEQHPSFLWAALAQLITRVYSIINISGYFLPDSQKVLDLELSFLKIKRTFQQHIYLLAGAPLKISVKEHFFNHNGFSMQYLLPSTGWRQIP